MDYKGYRCHDNTKYENTRDAKSTPIPCSTMKNTECPFKLVVKILKARITYIIGDKMVK